MSTKKAINRNKRVREYGRRESRSVGWLVGASKLSAELDGNCPFDKLNGQVIGLFVGRTAMCIQADET